MADELTALMAVISIDGKRTEAMRIALTTIVEGVSGFPDNDHALGEIAKAALLADDVRCEAIEAVAASAGISI